MTPYLWLLTATALSGCASFESNFTWTPAGVTTVPVSPGFVEFALEHQRQMHTPEMERAIAEARGKGGPQ